MPATEGREQGKPWTEVRPNGQTIEYTIPEGNGKNTVDAVVKDATGKVVSTARIVAIEGTAKYVRWQDDVGGGSSYFESGGPNGLGNGQHFAPGTSTSGIPTQAFETSPDVSKTRTLSLDSAGRVVGVDIGVRNPQGLYDNIHVDNFDNATLSSTSFSPSGQLESKFSGQMFANRSGWMIDKLGNHWEGEPDKGGNQSWFRVQNGHTYRMNHLGVITDFSLDKDGRPRLDTIFPDGSQTTQTGRTIVHFDANGKEVWKNEIPAPVQPWDVRAWDATKRGLSGLGSVISDTVGAPFHMMQDGVRGMSSVRVDQYGTFHVTYDAPNRFANAGTAVAGLAKGAAMFYLALPKYAAMTGYDALRGSDFVRGSTTYQPPDREDELVKDLTGIPLKQWKDDTVGSVFEFGAATVGGLILFRSVGIRPPTRLGAAGLLEISSGFRGRATSYISAHSKSALAMASGFASRIARYGGEQAERLRDWGNQQVKYLDLLDEFITNWTDRLAPQAVPAGGPRNGIDSYTSAQIAASRTPGPGDMPRRSSVEAPRRTNAAATGRRRATNWPQAYDQVERSQLRMSHTGVDFDLAGGEFITLFHGTIDRSVPSIIRRIQLSKGRESLDFGQGFYTTTIRRQAELWAQGLANKRGGQPAILEYRLTVDQLNALERLTFGRDYKVWARFIIDHRSGRRMHPYDIVEGPFVKNPNQMAAGTEAPIPGGQQMSWHTERAVRLLESGYTRYWVL
ncbi:DUF3990 domain-containing protein [Nocardia sp. NPDC055029]